MARQTAGMLQGSFLPQLQMGVNLVYTYAESSFMDENAKCLALLAGIGIGQLTSGHVNRDHRFPEALKSAKSRPAIPSLSGKYSLSGSMNGQSVLSWRNELWLPGARRIVYSCGGCCKKTGLTLTTNTKCFENRLMIGLHDLQYRSHFDMILDHQLL